jgi:hypothetical protein
MKYMNLRIVSSAVIIVFLGTLLSISAFADNCWNPNTKYNTIINNSNGVPPNPGGNWTITPAESSYPMLWNCSWNDQNGCHIIPGATANIFYVRSRGQFYVTDSIGNTQSVWFHNGPLCPRLDGPSSNTVSFNDAEDGDIIINGAQW